MLTLFGYFVRHGFFPNTSPLEVDARREHPRGVHTLAEMAERLNRSTVYLSGLQKRFELPAFEGAT